MASCSSGSGAGMPTSIFSAVGLRRAQQARVDEVVVEHHVGLREALEAADGDEVRVARPGANQIDDGFSHDAVRFYGESALVLCLNPPRLLEDLAGTLRQQFARPRARRGRAPRRARPCTTVRIMRLPSSATTAATSSNWSSRTGVASAPIGV